MSKIFNLSLWKRNQIVCNLTCRRVLSAQVARDSGQYDTELVHAGEGTDSVREEVRIARKERGMKTEKTLGIARIRSEIHHLAKDRERTEMDPFLPFLNVCHYRFRGESQQRMMRVPPVIFP